MAWPTSSPHYSYQRRVSTYWWLGRWPYLRFILREISSLFVAWFVVLTLLELAALGRGPEAWARFSERMAAPWMVGLNAISLAFVVYHALTWFHLAPKAMAIRIRGKRVPAWAIMAPNYVAWAAVSVALAWLVMRG
jgi:fumarate reductase subunit C